MTVCYLEIDDEITDAVARLRTADDRRFILVLPPGSRIATSRINFRLLAREAQERNVMVAMVSREAGVRSLAISAGMPAYGSLEEAEVAMPPAAPTGAPPSIGAAPVPPIMDSAMPASLTTGMISATPVEPTAAQARRSASATNAAASMQAPTSPPPSVAPSAPSAPSVRSGTPIRATPAPNQPAVPGIRPVSQAFAPPNGPDLEATRVLPRSSASHQMPHPGTPATVPPTDAWQREEAARRPARARGRSVRRRLFGWVVRLAIIAGLIGGALYAAYLYLPNVTVTIEPLTTTAGPLTVEVTADPSVAVSDPDKAVVPAQKVDIPLSATDDFPATGTDVVETSATGTVTFTSENTLFQVPIPEGTKVTTDSGLAFLTTEPVTLDKATFANGPSTVDATIKAVNAGTRGNVDAGAITTVPDAFATQLVKVTNADPTTGGSHTETLVVTKDDYDAAVASLSAKLDASLAQALTDPATTPSGLVSFPATGTREKATTDPASGDIVGKTTDTFTLSAQSTGTVLAVDEGLVAAVAAERLQASATGTSHLFPDTIVANAGTGKVVDGNIVYEATATAQQYATLDQGALVRAIRGKTVDQARVILAAYGTVQITPWPDFIGTVPDDPRRINLTILQAQPRSP